MLLVRFRECAWYPLGPYVMQVKSDCFIINMEAFDELKLATVLLYGRLQDLGIPDLWSANARFITMEQISRSEILDAWWFVNS